MSTGYTLPVFACASAIAALGHLRQKATTDTVKVDLLNPPQVVDITIEQVAKIADNTAIAIARSDPGDHLDLTRHTPIWAKLSLGNISDCSASQITLQGGEGVGRHNNQAAIYSYAQKLIQANLQPLLRDDETVVITIILPEGIRLAKRTSNAAFGVLEGLSLLGTTGIVQPLTAPDQLETYQAQIKAKGDLYDCLVFCIGENGIDLAQKSGIDPQRIIKTANWLGSMLATAGLTKTKAILLFGYHGKLIKLAGGIFHTHNHLADGRLEILTAYCAKLGLPQAEIEQIFACSTTEAALTRLKKLDLDNPKHPAWVDLIYQELAEAIDLKSQDYVYKYTERKICVGSVLFDRQRNIIKKSRNALSLLGDLC